MTPIFKGGDDALTSNYRPISKQCIIPKIFESIVTMKLSLLLKKHYFELTFTEGRRVFVLSSVLLFEFTFRLIISILLIFVFKNF